MDLPEAGIPAMPTRRREEFNLVELNYLDGLVAFTIHTIVVL